MAHTAWVIKLWRCLQMKQERTTFHRGTTIKDEWPLNVLQMKDKVKALVHFDLPCFALFDFA